MDNETKTYRVRQLGRVEKALNESDTTIPAIKIVSGNGSETNYLNISRKEFEKIQDILIFEYSLRA